MLLFQDGHDLHGPFCDGGAQVEDLVFPARPFGLEIDSFHLPHQRLDPLRADRLQFFDQGIALRRRIFKQRRMKRRLSSSVARGSPRRLRRSRSSGLFEETFCGS